MLSGSTSCKYGPHVAFAGQIPVRYLGLQETICCGPMIGVIGMAAMHTVRFRRAVNV